MSVIRCEICAHLIDSDEDPDCFVEEFWTANNEDKDAVLCEQCREKHIEAVDG